MIKSRVLLKRRDVPAFAASIALHLLFLVPLAYVHLQSQVDSLKVAIETVFSEERPPEEFTKDLNSDTTVAENLNVVAGGAVVSAVAGGSASGPAVSQQKIEQSEQFKTPQIVVNVGQITLPGIEQLGNDLGESQVTGEVAAVVEGYGPALGRITQELLRMMREEKVLAVWLFDESESMKDDQAIIREQFHKVYEELGIVTEKDSKLRGQQEILLTAIHSFGKTVHDLTPKPTANIPEIRTAIDKIVEDPSGLENTCAAVSQMIDKYRSFVTQGKRKMVIILVSDESGDDGQLIDETIDKAKRARAPVYILGREAVFGYPIARIRWKDPILGLTHWLPIKRGPETALVEALQFDGFRERWDSFPSGFGPYEQARLAKETGGIFFVLPGEEENLVGQAAIDKRKFAFLDLKQYEPELVPRRVYDDTRNKSKFRATVAAVIKLLDPKIDGELRVREWHYPPLKPEFERAGQAEFNKALRTMSLLNQAVGELEKVKPLRAKEESQRWRANYDLILAQCMAYRVRLFQFLLAVEQHGTFLLEQQNKKLPVFKNPQSNEWDVARVPQMLAPTPQQIKITKIDIDELKKQEQAARDQFKFVVDSHPRTPWANRAEYELRMGFGIRFREDFHDPRYNTLDRSGIKIPTL